jgi:large repetitive protein
MKLSNVIGHIFCAIILSCISILGLTGCGGDSGPTPGSLSITTASLPEATVNQAYSASLSGSGGALPYTWSVSPGLPANLSLDTATGAITGTPATQTTTTHTFTLRDSSAPSQTVQQTLSLTIRPAPAVLAITTTSLPNGTVNQAYNRPVQASGGTPPLTWNIVAGTGTLPPGLNLNSTTGAISGTPTTAGTSSFTIRVADARGQSDTQALSITIGTAPPPPNPPNITTATLSSGTVGQSYSQPVQVTGGTGALTWSISAGTLPPGLNLNPINGVISGTPTAAGTSSFTVRVQDAGGLSDTQAFSITINQPAPPPSPSITTTSLPAGTIGQAYNQTLQATGGTGGLTWSIVSGNLPAGLNLDQTTGVISGTPTVPAGTSSFTARVADAAGQDDTQALSITINLANPPVITTTALPGGTVGQVYNQTLQATGGIGILTWALSGGSLPAMLSLSPDGVISGTPTNTGTTNFTVRVADTLNQFDTQSLSIAVSGALAITTNSLPNAEEGDSYRRTLQRSGGVAPFTWSVTPPLPDGLNLNASTGEITGTPEAGTEGTYDLTFTVQDSSAPTPQTANKLLELRIRD